MVKAPVMRTSVRAKLAPGTKYTMIDVAVRAGIGIVALNRPEVHTAFNDARVDQVPGVLG